MPEIAVNAPWRAATYFAVRMILVVLLLVASNARAETARWKKVAATGGIAAGTTGVGLAGAWFTRFDETLAPVWVPTLAAGSILLVGTLVAEGIRAAGARPPEKVRVEARLGWVYAHTPVARDVHTARLSLRHAHVRLDVDTEEQRAAAGAYGVWLLGEHRPGSTFAALAVEHEWRLDFARVRGRVGVGTDWLLVLDAALAFRAGPVEIEVDYDHRKDRLEGGIYLGKAPGFLGSVGASARWRFIFAEARLGTGGTTCVGLRWSY